MTKIIEKIPGIGALLLVGLSVLVVLMVYVGGNADSILNSAGEAMDVPKYTDALLYWAYFLLGFGFFIAILVALVKFGKNLIANPKSALKTLIPIVLFALLFVVSWSLGSTERMSIIGYEGTENEGLAAKFVDMVLYSFYGLFAILVLTIAGAAIYRKLK